MPAFSCKIAPPVDKSAMVCVIDFLNKLICHHHNSHKHHFYKHPWSTHGSQGFSKTFIWVGDFIPWCTPNCTDPVSSSCSVILANTSMNIK
jgi:hypothetical protein